jgi:hypothetical protein
MSRRKEWQKVLDSEVKRWSALPCGQLVSELHEAQGYEVEFEIKAVSDRSAASGEY